MSQIQSKKGNNFYFTDGINRRVNNLDENGDKTGFIQDGIELISRVRNGRSIFIEPNAFLNLSNRNFLKKYSELNKNYQFPEDCPQTKRLRKIFEDKTFPVHNSETMGEILKKPFSQFQLIFVELNDLYGPFPPDWEIRKEYDQAELNQMRLNKKK